MKLKCIFLTDYQCCNCMGLDDLRDLSPVDIYAPINAIEDLSENKFPYVFKKKPIDGGGVPDLNLIETTLTVSLLGRTITPPL